VEPISHSGNQPGILKTIPLGCADTLLLSTLNGIEIKVSTPPPPEQTNAQTKAQTKAS